MKPSAINALEFEVALEHYRSGRDDEEACTDLLTDAMHFMAFNFLNISTVLSRARMHFDAEARVVTDESVGIERHHQIIGSYAVYQLAYDESIYGEDAGKFIVTSADYEREFSGPMNQADATAFATALNACTMVVGRWEQGDLAEAARACQVVIAHVNGRAS
jgi:hypothetical protein